MLIINDIHIGVNRSGGTTVQSQVELQDAILQQLEACIEEESHHVVVNGDLFDSFSVDLRQVIDTYHIFSDWVSEHQSRLTLIAGNHDWSPKDGRVSSFHLLGFMLTKGNIRGLIEVLDYRSGFYRICDGVYCIPHMPNQNMFDDMILEAVKSSHDGQYLLLHCNYRNNFAANSDHSLNLSENQVDQLMEAGWTLIIGHEHKGYTLRGGRVIVVGNQFPTSISDCIDDTEKRMLNLNLLNRKHDEVEMITTWESAGQYEEIDWKDLEHSSTEAKFIRVIGAASIGESSDVVRAMSKFRQASTAFIISNAVKVESHTLSSDIEISSMEEIQSFNVFDTLMSELSEDERVVIKQLYDQEMD